jgi:hypothetical protein
VHCAIDILTTHTLHPQGDLSLLVSTSHSEEATAGVLARAQESVTLNVLALSQEWGQFSLRVLTKVYGKAAVSRHDLWNWLDAVIDYRVDTAHAAVTAAPASYGLLPEDCAGNGTTGAHLSSAAKLQVLHLILQKLTSDISALQAIEQCYMAADLNSDIMALMLETLYDQAAVPCPLDVLTDATSSACSPAPADVTADVKADVTADVIADVTVISSRSDAPPASLFISQLPTIAEATVESATSSRVAVQLTKQQKRNLKMLQQIADFASTQEGTLVSADDILRRFAPSSSVASSSCTASSPLCEAKPSSSTSSSSRNAHSSAHSSNTLSNCDIPMNNATTPASLLLSSSSGSSDVIAADTSSSSSSGSSANNMSSSSSSSSTDNTIVSKLISGFDKLICSLSFGSNSSTVSTAPPSPTGSSNAK